MLSVWDEPRSRLKGLNWTLKRKWNYGISWSLWNFVMNFLRILSNSSSIQRLNSCPTKNDTQSSYCFVCSGVLTPADGVKGDKEELLRRPTAQLHRWWLDLSRLVFSKSCTHLWGRETPSDIHRRNSENWVPSESAASFLCLMCRASWLGKTERDFMKRSWAETVSRTAPHRSHSSKLLPLVCSEERR